MADTDQQLEDVRKKIQEAEIEKSAALALGAEAYAAALAHLTSLQNKENILIQQNQGEQICAMHGEIVTSQRNLGPLEAIKRVPCIPI